jgi:iron complex outermembrane recepter protein
MTRVVAFCTATVLAAAAFAQDPVSPSPTPKVEDSIQVTATRIPEQVLDTPVSVTIVTAAELEARGAYDLASALSLAAGVAIAPSGDGGPASSVPELMGLREFDAFLLVVDGVPWGGAFNPALSSLDLTNVERIEILRGSAPVLFGATSFVGVIHVIHRQPEDTPGEARTWAGNHGSGGIAASTAFGGGTFRHSLSVSAERQGLADPDAGFDRGHLLWTGVGNLGAGKLRLSLDLTGVRQDPDSPHPREGASLSPLVPLDSNHNPTDAAIDEDRFHLVVGYERPLGSSAWTTTLALTDTQRDTVRGFLREDFHPTDGASNAAGFRQEFSGFDYYLDSHVAWSPSDQVSLVGGIDLLGGKGEAMSENFRYSVALDGSGAPSSASVVIDERPEFEDERAFAGLYGQVVWRPTPRFRVDAGLRLNNTREEQEGEVEGEDGDELAMDKRDESRLSGGVGVSTRLWERDSDSLWLFVDYRDAFKPAAVDFGPEAEGEILEPETAQTVEVGVKGSHQEGRLSWQVSAFQMDFDNLVISRTVDGRPSLQNAGQQRFEGTEIEGRWLAREDLTVQGSWAWHSAKFRDFVQEFDGVPTQLSGHRLEMSPDQLGALGLTWAPEEGWLAALVGNHVGERFLNKRNSAVADAYDTLSASLGYRFARGDLRVDGYNLTDERPPISESELGESSYYRLPARSYRVSWVWRFGG